MSVGLFVTETVATFVLAAFILYQYGNWFRHHIIVTLAVLLAWYFSFLIIFILPLDVSSTVFRQCVEDNIHFNKSDTSNSSIILCEEPWSSVPDYVFPNLWRVVYWTSQFLTWLVMPMMQSYIKAGDFTVRGKLKSALIDNAIYYGSYLLICGILLIYLALKPGVDLDGPKIKAIASTASNTWGLFLLVLLLGYALVDVPRNIWKSSKHTYVLNRSYFKIAKLSSDRCEAEETVDDVLESLKAVSHSIHPGHYLRESLETILQKIPAELQDRMNRRSLPDDSSSNIPTEKSLIRLHKQTIKSLQVLQRTETQWNILVEKVFNLEDMLKSMSSREKKFKHSFLRKRNFFARTFYSPTIEWYWKCVVYAYVLRAIAVLAAVLSVAVVWSEVTFFNKQPVLSIFANIVNISKKKYDYFTIEVISTIVIAYLCYCVYSTVLKIKVLNLYYLAPYHQTNEYSLIFSGMMLSRLTPPMCLNFLGLIHMDSHVIKRQFLETHYTQVMGHMDVISIVSDGFNIYFPIAILAFCVCTYFSLGSRLLTVLGFHQFIDDDDEVTNDLVDEGRELIKREKRRRQRAEESLNRRREFQERFPLRGRFQAFGNNDTVRSVQSDPSQENQHASLLNESESVDRYSGTCFSEINTRISGLDVDDINYRFGISTRNIINDGRNITDTEFGDAAEDRIRRNHVGPPPKGLFDDV